MQAIRQIYQDTPSVIHIDIPEALQHHPVEVIIRPLEETSKQELYANGWPLGFFEETVGAWAGEPLEREPHGEYEQCELLK